MRIVSNKLDREKYTKLLVEVMPAPPTSDAENRALLAIARPLMTREDLTPEETSLLALLALLIEDYEKKRYPEYAEGATPAELLSLLMQEHNLTQYDFPPIQQSKISEILNGKRKISKAQALAFGERFKVDPAAFLYS
jgi:HTH-type transcriptional regulator/antitoxin HigA